MAALIDFNCADCDAKAGSPCVYVMPIGRPYSIAFALKQRYAEGRERWKYVEVPWSRRRPYIEDVQRFAADYRYMAEDPAEDLVIDLHSLPFKFRKVGLPLEKLAGHAARIRARYDWQWLTETQALQEYQREWFAKFGSIFEEAR